MKKLLLVSAVLLMGSCIVDAQNQRLIPSSGSKPSPILKNLPTDYHFPNSTSAQNPSPRKPLAPLASKLLGYTCYELQSNCAAPRNIINHVDGTVSFVWTIDDDCTSAIANRGSGYNYWNGTSLVIPGGGTRRIETIRTGFSRIALLGNGKEVIFAHKGDPYDFQMSTNAAKGSNVWTGIGAGATTLLPFPGATPALALWNRIAAGGADGNSIHLLAAYTTGAGKNKGITEPIVYSRSTDAGGSWDDQSVMLPGYDSTRSYQGSGEAYAIDAEGTTVAVVYGGLDEDVTLWKSTDNGATFARTFVDQWAFAPSIDSTGTPQDTAESNDGAVTVVVGPTGIVHVAYPTCRITQGSYYPTDAGLVYWNDVAKQKVHIPIALSDIDGVANGGNGTGAWEVGQYTSNINANAGTTPPSARYGNRAFLTIPSISVDGDNVFILFSLVSDGDSTVDGQSYRDLWIVASQDKGVTFGKIQNITCSQGEEEFFSCLAKRVDSKLHFMYDLDTEPGTNIQNGDPIAASELHYATVDKAKVLAGTAACSAGDGIPEHNTSVFNVSDNYPNPASDFTYFDITMKQNTSVSLEIFNNLGQQVYHTSEKLSTGKHTISVDASKFSSGLYFYTFSSKDAVASGKMTVITKR